MLVYTNTGLPFSLDFLTLNQTGKAEVWSKLKAFAEKELFNVATVSAFCLSCGRKIQEERYM